MASEAQKAALRADTGTDETSLPDDEIDTIYTDSETLYTAAASIDAHARVVVFRRLMAQAAARTTYKQNQSQENLSDLLKNYHTMVKFWQDELATAEVDAAALGAVRIGNQKRVPSRYKEFPNA
jgi:hypothetical protein